MMLYQSVSLVIVFVGAEKLRQAFSLCAQMIAAQKQLIESADAVQERIAQVQREGKGWQPVPAE